MGEAAHKTLTNARRPKKPGVLQSLGKGQLPSAVQEGRVQFLGGAAVYRFLDRTKELFLSSNPRASKMYPAPISILDLASGKEPTARGQAGSLGKATPAAFYCGLPRHNQSVQSCYDFRNDGRWLAPCSLCKRRVRRRSSSSRTSKNEVTVQSAGEMR